MRLFKVEQQAGYLVPRGQVVGLTIHQWDIRQAALEDLGDVPWEMKPWTDARRRPPPPSPHRVSSEAEGMRRRRFRTGHDFTFIRGEELALEDEGLITESVILSEVHEADEAQEQPMTACVMESDDIFSEEALEIDEPVAAPVQQQEQPAPFRRHGKRRRQ